MVEVLVRRARRRLVMNEALSQAAFAASVTLGGVAALLILGTRFLEGWALIPVALIGVGIGAFRLRRTLPDDYATAVRVDRNAGLHDMLSTAWHFADGTSDFRAAQRAQAETAAATVDLERAVPFTLPRSVYSMAGLAVLAAALVALRFYSLQGLDLRPPLTEVLLEDSAAGPHAKPKQSAAEAMQKKRLETAESLLAKFGVPLNPGDEKQPDGLDKALDQALENPGGAGAKADKSQGGKEAGAMDQTPPGDPMDDSQPAGQSAKSPESKDSAGSNKAASKNGAGDGSSLLSKLKDAVSDLFSKAAQKDAAGQKGQPQKAAAGAKGEKGAGQKSASQGQNQSKDQPDAQEGDPDGEGQQGQQADGKAGAKSSQQSSQAGNGVGSQDGSKDLRAAEQLKAMGKISEIIGKRAATVSGETTIEVESGKQQLRTAYSNQKVAHSETDSGSGRDEIPVSMQNYVQQYFEQVRKTEGAAKTKPVEKAATP